MFPARRPWSWGKDPRPPELPREGLTGPSGSPLPGQQQLPLPFIRVPVMLWLRGGQGCEELGRRTPALARWHEGLAGRCCLHGLALARPCLPAFRVERGPCPGVGTGLGGGPVFPQASVHL